MTDHAPLPPSSAACWVQCGRSVSLCEQFPQEDTDATREGTAAHWVLSERLQGREVRVGQLDPDGTPVDRDMILAAEEFAKHIQGVVDVVR